MRSFKEQVWDAFARIDDSDCLFKVFQTVNIEGFDISREILTSTEMTQSLAQFTSSIENENLKIKEEKLLILLNAYGCDNFKVKNLADWALDNMRNPRHHLVIFTNNAGVRNNTKATVQHVPCTTELEFAKKVARHMEILVSNQPKGSVLRPSKAEYPQKVVNTENLEKSNIKFDHNYILNIKSKFQMLMSLKSKSRKLIVMGQDAITRNNVDLPVFFRWSWAIDLPYSVIVLNDPTLYLNDSLNGGWFVGSNAEDYARVQADIIRKIVSWGALTDVTFFGASAGGFSSIMLATCYGYGAQAIVDIPQIDLQTYHARNEVLNLFNTAFNVNNTTVHEDLKYRVDVTKRFEKYKFVPKIKYMHNVKDNAHIEQFNYFIKRWSEVTHKLDQSQIGELTIHTYAKWHLTKGGHVPLSRKETIDQIISFID
tara:strand:- start:166 stop:1446 length:1281 start_codon:yes stop_codon:yes gene_type:complete